MPSKGLYNTAVRLMPGILNVSTISTVGISIIESFLALFEKRRAYGTIRADEMRRFMRNNFNIEPSSRCSTFSPNRSFDNISALLRNDVYLLRE